MIAFTICARNFFGYALSLHESLARHHPDVRFHVAVCDDLSGFDTASFNFEITSVAELGIPAWDTMRSRYNITELNTAIKPFVFSYLFDRYPGEVIVYLDPDIFVTSRMIELEACFERGANCVLTPHILEPAEFAEFDDRQFIRYGIYNLGFCALRDTYDTRRAVAWWGRRLEHHCVIDLPDGLFVDQKWAELLPCFVPDAAILRHPGYNVAYWNLSQRRVRLRDGAWTVNGEPLRFFHFSGNKIEDPSVFSRHCSQFHVGNIGDLALLLDDYRDMVDRQGHRYFVSLPYAFSWDGTSAFNEHTPRSVADGRTGAGGETPHLPLARFRSLSEFHAGQTAMTEVLAVRRRKEIEAVPAGKESAALAGYCACCGRTSRFRVSATYPAKLLVDGRPVPDWRDNLTCLSCGMANRVRAALQLFCQEFGPERDARILVVDRDVAACDWLSARFPESRSVTRIGAALPVDMRAGRAGDGSRVLPGYDYALVLDAPHHGPAREAAAEELFRCLREGGRILVAMHLRQEGEDHELPADIGHVPARRGQFGWWLVDDLKEQGFEEVSVLSYWSEQLLYFGDSQGFVAARKPVATSASRVPGVPRGDLAMMS